MYADLSSLGPWGPGEDARYEPCPDHAAALDRMDFDRAFEHAVACRRCRADRRPPT